MEQPQQPLFGRRVLVTRAAGQASELADQLQLAGATPILIPTIEIAPPTSFAALDAALSAMDAFDVIAFTSANAVQVFAERSKALGVRTAPRSIAAVGSATAKALQASGLTVDVVPDQFTAESLADKLMPGATGLRFLLVQAEDAHATLQNRLEAAGGKVAVAAAYRNRIPVASVDAIRELFASRTSWPDAATFTSASTATNLVGLLSEAKLEFPDQIVRASIGPVTSKAMAGLGIAPHVEAGESTIAGLAGGLAAYFARQR